MESVTEKDTVEKYNELLLDLWLKNMLIVQRVMQRGKYIVQRIDANYVKAQEFVRRQKFWNLIYQRALLMKGP